MNERLSRAKPQLLAGILAMIVAFHLAGCGNAGGRGSLSPPPQSGTLVLFAEDQAGENVLSFEMTITGATLVSSGGTEVSVLASPVRLEWTSRSLAPIPLSVTQVTAATYSQLRLVVASPEMRVFNTTTGQLENFTPSLSTSTVTLTINLTLARDQVVGARIDFDLLNSITSNSQVTPSFSFVPTSFVSGQLPGDIDDVLGTVASTDTTNNRFTMTVNPGSLTLTVQTDASTHFEGVSGLSALRTGDAIELDARLQSDGRFLALEVEVENQSGLNEIRGLVVSRTPATGDATGMDLLLLGENPVQASVDAGDVVTVNLDATTTLRINQEDFDLASDLRFSGFTFDRQTLAPGQVVAVELESGQPAGTFLADRVALKEATVIGTVASVGTTNFTFTPRSAFYAANSLGTITAQLTPNLTEFEDLPQGISSMQANQTVAVRGLLFASPATSVTKRVRLLAPP